MEKTDFKLETRDQKIRDMAEDSADELTFSFSSEQPVKRHFGDEVLSHREGDVDLSRLNTGGLLLWNHDRDKVLGRINEAWLKDGKGRANIRWASNSFAKEIRRDTENGIYTSISVGYAINEMEQQEDGSMRATSWQPHEISLVSIPADTSVGVGRSKDPNIYLNNQMAQSNNSPINTYVDEFAKELS